MSDYACVARKVLDKLVIQRGDGSIHDHLTLDTWEWPQGVAMYAMIKLYRSSGDRQLLETLINWYDGWLKKGLPPRNINTTAPMLALTCLYEETAKPEYLSTIRDWAAWVNTGLPRTQEGGFQHVTSDDFNFQQIWDDTLFMTVLFLYRAGTLLGRPEYKTEAEYQFLLHIKYLHSQKDHLWYHGYCFDGGHHFAGAYWCRGNSWFTCGAAEMLSWLEEGSVKRLIRNTYAAQCEALKNCQDEITGLWHTLLDDPASYTETSGSAAIAYGILRGIRLGLLPEKEFVACAERAVGGVLSMIDDDGLVNGVSYGTPMGHDKEFYRRVPIRPTAYGQGLAFLMLTELV